MLDAGPDADQTAADRAMTAASAAQALDLATRRVISGALTACPTGCTAADKAALAGRLNSLRRCGLRLCTSVRPCSVTMLSQEL